MPQGNQGADNWIGQAENEPANLIGGVDRTLAGATEQREDQGSRRCQEDNGGQADRQYGRSPAAHHASSCSWRRPITDDGRSQGLPQG